MAATRQIRRATERRKAKIDASSATYPHSTYVGFIPRGINYRDRAAYGAQEAARRVAVRT
jgi:hypothetical protein